MNTLISIALIMQNSAALGRGCGTVAARLYVVPFCSSRKCARILFVLVRATTK